MTDRYTYDSVKGNSIEGGEEENIEVNQNINVQHSSESNAI